MYLHCIVLPLESDVDFDLQLDEGSACTCANIYKMVSEKLPEGVDHISYEGSPLPNDTSKLSEFFVANGATLFITLASSTTLPPAASSISIKAAEPSAPPAAQHMRVPGNILSPEEMPRAVTVRNLPPLSEDGVHKSLHELFVGATITRTVVQRYQAEAGDSEEGSTRAQALVLFDTPEAAQEALLKDGSKVGAYAAQVAPAASFESAQGEAGAAATTLPGRYDAAQYASQPVAQFLAQGFMSGQRGLASVRKYWEGVEAKAAKAMQRLSASRPAEVLSATAADISRRATEYDTEHKLTERASSSWNKLVGRVTGAAKDIHEKASTNTTVARGLHSVVHAYRVVEAAVDGTIDAAIGSVQAQRAQQPQQSPQQEAAASSGDSETSQHAAPSDMVLAAAAAAPSAKQDGDAAALLPAAEAPPPAPEEDVFGDLGEEDTAV